MNNPLDNIIRKHIINRVIKDYYLADRYNLSTKHMTPNYGPFDKLNIKDVIITDEQLKNNTIKK